MRPKQNTFGGPALARAIAVLTLAVWAAVAGAQSPYRPIIDVNEGAITQFELDQRIQLLTIMSTPGDIAAQAREGLIDDRLRVAAARRFNVELAPEDLERELERFAARTNLPPDRFLEAMAREGIAEETITDFLEAGIVWGVVVNGLFAGQVQVTEAEIDRAIAQSQGQGGLQVLLSEIVLPLTPEIRAENMALAEEFSRTLRSQSDFEQTARRFSASRTRRDGGRLDWTPLSNLPPEVAAMLLSLSPGENTPPLSLPNAVVVFKLRALQEGRAAQQRVGAVDYAVVRIPGGQSDAARSDAARIIADAATCDDLFAVAPDPSPDGLSRQVLPPAQIPTQFALELARLDPGEISTALTTPDGQTMLMLMLCGRSPVVGEDVSREEVSRQLRNGRLQSLGASYLAELRADADIRFR